MNISGSAVSVHILQIKDDHIRMHAGVSLKSSFAEAGVGVIITVRKHDPFALAQGKTGIAGSTYTLILLYGINDPVIRRGIFLTDPAIFFTAAVIDQDHFDITKCLCQQTVQTTFQIFFRMIDRYDDRDLRLIRVLHILVKLYNICVRNDKTVTNYSKKNSKRIMIIKEGDR